MKTSNTSLIVFTGTILLFIIGTIGLNILKYFNEHKRYEHHVNSLLYEIDSKNKIIDKLRLTNVELKYSANYFKAPKNNQDLHLYMSKVIEKNNIIALKEISFDLKKVNNKGIIEASQPVSKSKDGFPTFIIFRLRVPDKKLHKVQFIENLNKLYFRSNPTKPSEKSRYHLVAKVDKLDTIPQQNFYRDPKDQQIKLNNTSAVLILGSLVDVFLIDSIGDELHSQ